MVALLIFSGTRGGYIMRLKKILPQIRLINLNYICLYFNIHPLMLKSTPPQKGHKAGVNSPIFV
jgi:hypothetical protein